VGWQVISSGHRGIGQPHCDGPVDERHEEEVDSLIAWPSVVAAVEGQLIHQIKVEPRRLHCSTCKDDISIIMLCALNMPTMKVT